MRWIRGIKHRVLSLLGRSRAAEELDGDLYSIVGVLPSFFQLPRDTEVDVYAVLQVDEPPRRGPFYLRGMVRLAEGTSPALFQEHLSSVTAHTKSLYPEGTDNWRYGIRPL